MASFYITNTHLKTMFIKRKKCNLSVSKDQNAIHSLCQMEHKFVAVISDSLTPGTDEYRNLKK